MQPGWELGEKSKSVKYFEQHLEKDEEAYLYVMEYYRDLDPDKAVKTARRAIEKCKKDQTPFFVFLLLNARNRGDVDEYNKLMRSAKMRRSVDTSKVEKALAENGN